MFRRNMSLPSSWSKNKPSKKPALSGQEVLLFITNAARTSNPTFSPVFARACHWSLSWARWVQSTPPHIYPFKIISPSTLEGGWERKDAYNIYALHTQTAKGISQKYNTCGAKRGTTTASFLELTKHRLQQHKGHSSSIKGKAIPVTGSGGP
jgi:hypothetical protein